MSAPTLTLAQIKKLEPCKERLTALRKVLPKSRRITAAEAQELGATLEDLLWAAEKMAERDADVRRRLSLFSADCAARVLHIYERTERSDAPRRAIETERAYVRGKIDDAARINALRLARFAARSHTAAWFAASAARDIWAASAAAFHARIATRRDIWAASAEGDVIGAARGAAAAEEAWQLDRLVARMSNPEPKDWPLPVKPERNTE